MQLTSLKLNVYAIAQYKNRDVWGIYVVKNEDDIKPEYTYLLGNWDTKTDATNHMHLLSRLFIELDAKLLHWSDTQNYLPTTFAIAAFDSLEKLDLIEKNEGGKDSPKDVDTNINIWERWNRENKFDGLDVPKSFCSSLIAAIQAVDRQDYAEVNRFLDLPMFTMANKRVAFTMCIHN